MVFGLNKSKFPQKVSGFVFFVSLFSFSYLRTTLCHLLPLVLFLVLVFSVALVSSLVSLVWFLAWLGLSTLVLFSGLVQSLAAVCHALVWFLAQWCWFGLGSLAPHTNLY